MSNQFHNRLVGTIVVVALGVIFLPDILDGKKQRQEEQFAEIPLRPEITKQEVPQQATQALSQNQDDKTASAEEWVVTTHETAENLSQTSSPATKPEKVAAAKPEQTEEKQVVAKGETTNATKQADSKPAAQPQVAWTLQLGSFNHAGNVNALVKKLRKAGFRAYTLPKVPVDGSLTKVFVGPDISKKKIEKLRKDVEKVTKLKGRILPYNPLETSS